MDELHKKRYVHETNTTTVPCRTMDAYLEASNITHVDFLRYGNIDCVD